MKNCVDYFSSSTTWESEENNNNNNNNGDFISSDSENLNKNLYRETADSLVDYLNLNKERNFKNTRNLDYNCGGFALKTFSWYKPYDKYVDIGNLFFEDLSEDADRITDYLVENMVKDFNNRIREVQDESEVTEEEEVVLFRVGVDSETGWADFHFMLKDKNTGLYLDKRGGTGIFNKSRSDQVYNGDWYGEYNGPIAILALKNA